MRVEIDSTIFSAPGVSQNQICTILGYGFAERVRIVTIPSFVPDLPPEPGPPHPARVWLDALPHALRQEYEMAFSIGIEAETKSPSKNRIRVVPGHESNWDSPIPELSLSVAVDYLQRPFRVLIENERNDGNFLLSVAREDDRKFLQTWIAHGWHQLENAGGIGEIEVRVKQRRQNRAETMRMWVMFDNDGMQPNTPSHASARLHSLCNGFVPFHQLQRRSIENYLTIEMLGNWAKKHPKTLKVSAFAALSPTQRHHYNMKEGFEGDSGRINPGAGTLYDGLHPNFRQWLADGFGKDIANLFDPALPSAEAWYDADGQTAETGKMISELLELL